MQTWPTSAFPWLRPSPELRPQPRPRPRDILSAHLLPSPAPGSRDSVGDELGGDQDFGSGNPVAPLVPVLTVSSSQT